MSIFIVCKFTLILEIVSETLYGPLYSEFVCDEINNIMHITATIRKEVSPKIAEKVILNFVLIG
ncbi:hypothetical protein [Clostridium beijerinckii]|uniref:hypothetical protein n=1 Tax=Clostridium beijerinckii TaxID=1520 RepID=UPI000311486E|nr:hypothetical protein [Clostridium beijerinckii]